MELLFLHYNTNPIRFLLKFRTSRLLLLLSGLILQNQGNQEVERHEATLEVEERYLNTRFPVAKVKLLGLGEAQGAD